MCFPTPIVRNVLVPRALLAGMLLTGCMAETGAQTSNIIGGEEAPRAQFPSIVAFGTYENAGRAMTCTATRVGESTFLTAAHCLLDHDTGALRPEFAPEEWVTFYKGTRVDAVYRNMMDLQIRSLSVVPNRDIDVALIHTTKLSADDARDVAIATIASSAAERVAPGDLMVLAGYGQTSVSADDGSRSLHSVTVTAGGPEVFEQYRGQSAGSEADWDIPIDVRANDGKSQGFGDSGGPAYLPVEPDGVHATVIGVASAFSVPGAAWGDYTVDYAEYARVDDGGRYAVGTWLLNSIEATETVPLLDQVTGQSLVLRTHVFVPATELVDQPFPVTASAGSFAIELEPKTEPDGSSYECLMKVTAVRAARGSELVTLVQSSDDPTVWQCPESFTGAIDQLVFDLSFPEWDEIDNESEYCALRVSLEETIER